MGRKAKFSGVATSVWLAAASAFLAPAAQGAPIYEYTINAPGPFQVFNSPTAVGKTATATTPDGTFSSATTAAAGPGYLQGSSHATLDLPNGALGTASGFSQESSDFNLDNIIISGPAGEIVHYTINVNVSGSIGANISGSGPFFAAASAGLRFSTNSSLGGEGGVDLGHITASNGLITEKTGIFSNFAGAASGTTPVWSARGGETISVGLILDTVASTTESFGSGPGAMDAFADFSHTALFAPNVFNFYDPVTNAPVTGWTANSTDGCIVDNAFTCAPPTQAVPEPTTLALLSAGLGFLGFSRRRSRSIG
ncbi:MAG TPA: PEP-CTERM sorting domain-containing protein [Burkholderiales bacterium]|nr:PEP-CTERM sorting domain-containing protein [Burkholderiales bacterium]